MTALLPSAEVSAAGGRRREQRVVRVLVADDHPLTLQAVVDVLRADGVDVVATATSVDELVGRYRELHPDIVLTDLRMGEPMAGLDAAREILGDDPAAQIICFSGSEGGKVVEDVLAAGCVGFVTKTGSGEDFVAAVRTVASGDQYVDARSAGSLLRRLNRRNREVEVTRLAARELAVLRLAADGRSNSQIAAELMVAESTVKTYVSRILEKLDVTDRTEAVAMALRRGLID